MPRFYCDLPLAPGCQIDLPLEAARHAVGSLRLRNGDAVTLFNGDGAEYPGSLELRGKNAFVRISSRAEPERESSLHITLAQGISSGERMDLTLQKAVELGTSAIQPLMMRRTVVKLSGEKMEKRLRHWQGVVIAACEQCGRNHIPPVGEIQDGLAWLRNEEVGDTPNRFLLDPEGDVGLADLPPAEGPVLLLVGPEGGFDPVEHKMAIAAGFRRIRLGPRILRTETAALAALAAMQTRWGDYR